MSDTLPDMPDDVRAEIEPHLAITEAVLSQLGIEIAGKLQEAKAARASSGIESTWQECEDAYDGIDNANRGEVRSGRWSKGLSPDSPVTTGRTNRGEDHRSTVYLRLTTRYVDAGTAKLAEILLPADEKAFSFSEMPVPELIDAKEDDSQVVHSGLGVPLTRPLGPGETPPAPPPSQPAPAQAIMPSAPADTPIAPTAMASGATTTPAAASPGQPASPAPPQVPLKVKDFAVEKIEMARKQAKAAETRIYDWMTQTQYRAAIRKVIADAARLGVGVLKGPVPVVKRTMVMKANEDGPPKLEFREDVVPGCVEVDPWNIYPDPSCGENIHDGDYICELDYFSAKRVRRLKDEPGYIKAQIDKVLKEGPNKINTTQGRSDGDKSTLKNERFEVCFYYGVLNKDQMRAIDEAAGVKPPSLSDGDPDEAYVIVTLINDSVVRAIINPLDSGEFPYHSMPWQRRANSWAGVGVAEQMQAPQRIANASLRALLNNAGISAGVQLIINRQMIVPADGRWEMTPHKIWWTTNDGPDDIRKAITSIEIPNATQQLTEIITMSERFAEETTSIPLITQGQSGATTPDTLGATQLQNNNANQLLRSIGYAFDDHITEPVVRQYYEVLLLNRDVPNEEKGEFQIDAHGSIALVERAIQDQTIGQMLQMTLNQAFGVDPKKGMEQFLKSHKLKPDDFQYTEEEQEKMAAAPPPEAPAVTVAKINTASTEKIAIMQLPLEQQTAQHAAEIAAAEHVLDTATAKTDQQKMHIDATLQADKQDKDQQRTLDELKVELAKTTMQLNTERALNAANNSVDLHKHHNPSPQPPVQVPGRAGNGKAFSQSGPPQ